MATEVSQPPISQKYRKVCNIYIHIHNFYFHIELALKIVGTVLPFPPYHLSSAFHLLPEALQCPLTDISAPGFSIPNLFVSTARITHCKSVTHLLRIPRFFLITLKIKTLCNIINIKYKLCNKYKAHFSFLSLSKSFHRTIK